MKPLSRWMKVVGVLYVLNGIGLVVSYVVPAIGEASVRQRVPGADLANPLYGFAMDTWLMFALEMLVVGGALVVASRAAWSNRILAFTVVALELIRGILDDLIWIANGYPAAMYMGWIGFHAVVIVTGVRALRRAQAHEQSEPLVPA